MRRLIVTLVAPLCLALAASTAGAEEWRVRHKAAGGFEATRDAVVMAIENRGLVINYISHIGDMLQRTGADLGTRRQIFEKAEIVEFCSAKLSRQMMEADPHNIVLCPFAISIYTLPGAPDTAWVSYRQPPGAAARIVEPLLREIAAEATQ